MQTGISLTTLDAGIHAHINAHNTHTCTHTNTRGCTSTTQNHMPLFVCAHSYDTPTCMYTPSAHTCAHIPHTHDTALVHIHLYMHAHLCTYTQPHTAQVLKSPHEQALSPPFLCGLSTHEICLVTQEKGSRCRPNTGSCQQCPGSGGGVVLLVVIGLMCPQHREAGKDLLWQLQWTWSTWTPPALSACQTSTLLEIRNTQPWFLRLAWGH